MKGNPRLMELHGDAERLVDGEQRGIQCEEHIVIERRLCGGDVDDGGYEGTDRAEGDVISL